MSHAARNALLTQAYHQAVGSGDQDKANSILAFYVGAHKADQKKTPAAIAKKAILSSIPIAGLTAAAYGADTYQTDAWRKVRHGVEGLTGKTAAQKEALANAAEEQQATKDAEAATQDAINDANEQIKKRKQRTGLNSTIITSPLGSNSAMAAYRAQLLGNA